eukprot:gene32295-39055_t
MAQDRGNSVNYGIAAVVQGEGEINNLDFHSEGRHLVASSGQSCLHLIDCMSGEERKKIHCKSAGVGHVKFSHHEQCVLVTPRLRPHDIRYLSLYDNRYLNIFQGHTEYITSLSMCPVDDTFLTASEDKTIRRWDIVSGKQTMHITLPSVYNSPMVSFDCSGLVYGVHAQNAKTSHHTIRLYDARFTSEPFQDISPVFELYKAALSVESMGMSGDGGVDADRVCKSEWHAFSFSNEGNYLLCNTDTEVLWVLDGFRPDVTPVPIVTRRNEYGSKLGACYSTDDKYIFTGSGDSDLLVLDAKTGDLCATLMGHTSSVTQVASNPMYQIIASGCVNIALWMPTSP